MRWLTLGYVTVLLYHMVLGWGTHGQFLNPSFSKNCRLYYMSMFGSCSEDTKKEIVEYIGHIKEFAETYYRVDLLHVNCNC